tara:strand:- start:8672 stop:9910 length:1239 start_codon:yes stop_codon:yes gene_type:complete
MAVSTTYCTNTDILDVYPNIDEFDSKTPLFGWTTETFTKADASTDTFYAIYNSGFIPSLFIDSKEQVSGKLTIGTTKIGDTAEAVDNSETVIDITGTLSDFSAGSFIKINSEIMYVTTVTDASTDTLTVIRGCLGTHKETHDSGADIFQHFKPSTNGQFLYDSDNDFLILKYGSDPVNSNVESGTNFNTLTTRIRKNASRYFDSRVDANLPRDQWKDKEGNYDYIVVRTTALISAYFLINARQPGSELALQFMDEINFNLDQLNSGKVKLGYQVSSDSSSGILREVVSPQRANPLHIVDTRGNYNGSYDLFKIVITTAGVLGTAKFSVYAKGADNLKTNQVVTDKIINGQYQSIGSGLEIRFQGQDSSSAATAGGTPDEWELECWGAYESFDGSPGNAGNTRMTRKSSIRRY